MASAPKSLDDMNIREWSSSRVQTWVGEVFEGADAATG